MVLVCCLVEEIESFLFFVSYEGHGEIGCMVVLIRPPRLV